jgi:hypothetical protein
MVRIARLEDIRVSAASQATHMAGTKQSSAVLLQHSELSALNQDFSGCPNKQQMQMI